MTVLTTACHMSLSSIRSLKFPSCHPISLSFNLILFYLRQGLPSYLLPPHFQPKFRKHFCRRYSIVIST
jgi:hypothetical protein